MGRTSADQLTALLDESVRTIVLTGPPGIGKTTAMRALATRLAGPSTRVRRAQAVESSPVRPFGLGAAMVGLAAPDHPGDDCVEQLAVQLESQCGDGPMVLLADDLQHADPDSLRVVEAFVAATVDLPVRLVLAWRPLPMRPALAALAARPDVHAVELAGLDDAEVDALVRARLGLGPGTGLRALLSAAGGNPAHLGALLDGLEQRGRLVADHRAGVVELAGADPEDAAALLATVAGRGSDTDRDAVALTRARALAAAGQTAEAARVARERLTVTTDDAVRARLLRVVLHTTLSVADTAGIQATLQDARALALDPATRADLDRAAHFATVMAGRDDVDDDPAGPSPTAHALALYTGGHCARALAESEAAADAEGSDDWTTLSSAALWPALFALYAEGPATARERSVSSRRELQERGQVWLTPGLLFIAGTIDALVGRWDDALAHVDAGLEAAAASGSGWISSAIGMAMGLRVRRGELDRPRTELTRWRARGLPEQLGLPHVDLAETLLHEAQGRPDLAGALAASSWTRALDGRRRLWALLAGADTARIARWVRDDALLARVVTDVGEAPVDEVPTLAPAVDLVLATADGDPDRAAAAAVTFAARGNALGELGGWEEAAVAAAARGDHATAREHASRCSTLAGTLGARTVERRLAARLRAHDLRTAPPRSAHRPTSGWASLTPTELEVAGFVGEGLTSPQIAVRMFLSPRTVQTHVSHALAKLGLRTRSELAATVIRHQR